MARPVHELASSVALWLFGMAGLPNDRSTTSTVMTCQCGVHPGGGICCQAKPTHSQPLARPTTTAQQIGAPHETATKLASLIVRHGLQRLERQLAIQCLWRVASNF